MLFLRRRHKSVDDSGGIFIPARYLVFIVDMKCEGCNRSGIVQRLKLAARFHETMCHCARVRVPARDHVTFVDALGTRRDCAGIIHRNTLPRRECESTEWA